jgi:hypothetical protein
MTDDTDAAEFHRSFSDFSSDCMNDVANLLIGRTVIRSREISIRAALVAGCSRVIRRLTHQAVMWATNILSLKLTREIQEFNISSACDPKNWSLFVGYVAFQT